MFCAKCGQQIPEGSLFCNRCGARSALSADNANTSSSSENAFSVGNTGGNREVQLQKSRIEASSISCPNCGGEIKTLDGIDTYYCMYCGNKFILNGMSSAAYHAKTKVKEFQHEESMQERRFKNEHARWEREEESKEREAKRNNKSFWAGMGVILALLLLCVTPLACMGIKHSMREKELKKISLEIEEDIADGNYEHAMILTNRLRLNDDWSDEDTEEWDERREEYVRQIRRAQMQSGDYKTINAPLDSDDCDDYNKKEMVELFTNAGFTNISVEKVSGSAGLFSRSNIVKKVTIDGVSDFLITDSFVSSSEVVIYYYEK